MGLNLTLNHNGMEIKVITDGHGGGSVSTNLHDKSIYKNFNLCVDAIESVILAHAIGTTDIASSDYLDGIKTALESCENNTDEDLVYDDLWAALEMARVITISGNDYDCVSFDNDSNSLYVTFDNGMDERTFDEDELLAAFNSGEMEIFQIQKIHIER